MKPTPLVITSLLGLALLADVLPAHDFWIDPESHAPQPDALLRVGLRVGDHGQGDVFPRRESHLARFELHGPEGAVPVVGREGSAPAGVVRLGRPGTYVLGYQSHASAIELEAEAFNAYLAEEGLEDVLDARKRSGSLGEPARERYARCAKALLSTGPETAGFDRVLGFPLELVPRAHPAALERGPDGEGWVLPIQLLAGGKPLAGALVDAVPLDAAHGGAGEAGHGHPHPHAPTTAVQGRTDAQGHALLRLPHRGRWLVASVHMTPATTEEADWESRWASLTLAIPAVVETWD